MENLQEFADVAIASEMTIPFHLQVRYQIITDEFMHSKYS